MTAIEKILDFLTSGTTSYEKALSAAVVTQEILLSIIYIGVFFLFLIGYGDWVDNHYLWFALLMIVLSFAYFYCEYVYKSPTSSVVSKRISIAFMLIFAMLILAALKGFAVYYSMFTLGFFQFCCHGMCYIKPDSIRKYGLWVGVLFAAFYAIMCFYGKVGFNLSTIICFYFLVGVMIKQMHTCYMLGWALTSKPGDQQEVALQKQMLTHPLGWGYIYSFSEFIDILLFVKIFTSELSDSDDNRK